jgi:intracellular septation protein
MSVPTIFSPYLFKRILSAGLLEFGPIIIFLAAYSSFHIFKATTLLMIATIVSTIITYRLEKRIPYLALYLAFLTITFGYLTLWHKEPRFIQMRDTLYDLTCAITLLIGLMMNVSFLKIAFHEVLPMADEAWHKLTYAWIGYFIMIAFLNEYVRRSQTLDTWFDFKSGVVAFTIVFGFAALHACYRKEIARL